MKQFLIAFLLLLVLGSCDNEIDAVADFQTIPIVYAFIDTEADTNFIRIERAFLGEGQNANEVAQDPDSLYFGDDIEVTLIKSNGNTQTTLSRINGDDIGRPRSGGAFASSPNYLYYFTRSQFSLRPDDRLTLVIRKDEEEIARASTPMLSSPDLTSPYDDEFNIPFVEGNDTRIGYRLSTSAGMVGIRILFSFLEENSQGVFENKSVTWNILDDRVISDENGSERGSASVAGGDFFRFLAAELGSGDPNARRVSQSLDIELISVGKELRSIRNIQLANQGVTGSQELPVFTNIDNGRGIFSARSKFVQGDVNLSPRTLDSLVNGRITADLNFIN